ncbi:hypothetical protein L0636_01105 [Halomonas janggokensis]|uniref:Uncharacterized protein n=1 Tax=Vreelandella janggokensis TaxID=370767 RepID=A0ABT4IS37_9GAMM|nr:hypothetical protein [Halomonas janggokensis]MCZ0926486.1 hypothetical protein [Halomonas janggokensis]MCZ0929024.1 hypothetical protein [Halomonas janggokensis]
MIEYRVRKIMRYEVTRHSENIERTQGGVETVASNLTDQEADDITGAMYERANAMGMTVKATCSDGSVLTNQQEALEAG